VAARDWTQTLDFSIDGMPEGIVDVGVAALDVEHNTDSGSVGSPDFARSKVPVKVDRTGPQAPVPSGALHRVRGQVLFDQTLDLDLSATDRPDDRPNTTSAQGASGG